MFPSSRCQHGNHRLRDLESLLVHLVLSYVRRAIGDRRAYSGVRALTVTWIDMMSVRKSLICLFAIFNLEYIQRNAHSNMHPLWFITHSRDERRWDGGKNSLILQAAASDSGTAGFWKDFLFQFLGVRPMGQTGTWKWERSSLFVPI